MCLVFWHLSWLPQSAPFYQEARGAAVPKRTRACRLSSSATKQNCCVWGPGLAAPQTALLLSLLDRRPRRPCSHFSGLGSWVTQPPTRRQKLRTRSLPGSCLNESEPVPATSSCPYLLLLTPQDAPLQATSPFTPLSFPIYVSSRRLLTGLFRCFQGSEVVGYSGFWVQSWGWLQLRVGLLSV